MRTFEGLRAKVESWGSFFRCISVSPSFGRTKPGYGGINRVPSGRYRVMQLLCGLSCSSNRSYPDIIPFIRTLYWSLFYAFQIFFVICLDNLTPNQPRSVHPTPDSIIGNFTASPIQRCVRNNHPLSKSRSHLNRPTWPDHWILGEKLRGRRNWSIQISDRHWWDQEKEQTSVDSGSWYSRRCDHPLNTSHCKVFDWEPSGTIII
jgi:hypothetical protein